MRRLLSISLLFIAVEIPAQTPVAGLPGTNTDTSWFALSRPDFNTTASDFGVTQYGNGFVFTSARCDDLSVRYFSADSASPLLDLYYVRRSTDGKFQQPVAFSDEVNTRANNEGPGTFDAGGNFMVLTGNASDRAQLALLTTEQEKKRWTAPRVLPFCSTAHNYMHPCFASGDSVLFFASDQAGGYGGMDIYFVKRINGEWKNPVNAGRKINSPSDEVFPFCSASGNLYFSSNRQGGSGGLDIYVIAVNDTAFTNAQLLADPLNSPADDFGFFISTDDREGFFSSNRNNARSDDDLYHFTYQMPETARTDTIVPVELCFQFFEEATVHTGDTVKMKYTWTFSDGDVRYGYRLTKCFDTTGVYDIHLHVRDSSGGDVIVSDIHYEFLIEEPNYVSLQSPDSVRAHQSFTVNTMLSEIKGYEIQSVYYDLGNGCRGTGREITHRYHHIGVYYPRIYLLVRNKETGATESRCVVKKLVVL